MTTEFKASLVLNGAATTVLALLSLLSPGYGRCAEPPARVGNTIADSTPAWPAPAAAPAGAPNVVLIVLDDLGFAQLGSYGSQIRTPSIDRLAENGLRYTNFHVLPICSPTRAALLTGRNAHSVGMGSVPEAATGFPGYNAMIGPETATLAAILKQRGYATYAVGKWHITPADEWSAAGPFGRWPVNVGFDRFYGFMGGETNQWHPELWLDLQLIEAPRSPGYHLSEDLVDRSMAFIRDQRQTAPDRPFFLYLAFGAMHAPHHAPDAFIDRYEGEFEQGWDEVRRETLERQKRAGIVPAATRLPPRNPGIRAWESLSDIEKRVFARHQEVFAGFLEHTDHQVGRLLSYLEDIDEWDDTLIVIVSDNGASQEGGLTGTVNELLVFNGVTTSVEETFAQLEVLGSPSTHPNYPLGWAMAGNTPFRWYKQTVHMGGVRVPLILHWPGGFSERGAIRRQFHHAIDVLPTILEAIGIVPPGTLAGVPQRPIQGRSMVYSFDQPNAPTTRTTQYFEMFGHRAIWQEGWKAVTWHPRGGAFDSDRWELYDVREDFNEIDDLSGTYPKRLAALRQLWWETARANDVLPLDDRILERSIEINRRAQQGRKTFVYYPHAPRVPEIVAADVRNRSHEITAEVIVEDGGAEGVLLAQGGRFSGYALLAQDGRLQYVHNFVNRERYVITSDQKIAPGRRTLGFSFERTGDHQGIGRLTIDGSIAGVAEIPRMVPNWYGEGLQVGRDGGTPVGDTYSSPFPFNGEIERVTIHIAE